jgi:hypothetical protein
MVTRPAKGGARAWIILAVDRTRLGFAVFAVARPRPDDRPDKLRLTMEASRGRRFATRRGAEAACRRLAREHRLHLFTAVRLEPGDFPRRRVRNPLHQAGLFPENFPPADGEKNQHEVPSKRTDPDGPDRA